MKTIKRALTIILTSIFVSSAFSQGFVDIYPFPTVGDKCRVIKSDGSEIQGKWLGWTGTLKAVKSIDVKSADGEKFKLTPEDVKRIYIKQSGVLKFTMLVDKSYNDNHFTDANSIDQMKVGTIIKAVDNWDEIMNNETELVYEFVEEKAGKYGLREMINLGFDQKYKAFMFGYDYRKLILIDANGQQKIVSSSNYAEEFKNAFDDCEEFMNTVGSKVTSNDDFDKVANHLFIYSNMCNE